MKERKIGLKVEIKMKGRKMKNKKNQKEQNEIRMNKLD